MLNRLSDLSMGSQFIRSVLPLGGWVVTILDLYADESYGGDVRVGPLCLAAYIYERDEAIAATEAWGAVLRSPCLPKPARYFRMSSCAHSNGEFSGASPSCCDEIARKIIGIAKQHSMVGFASAVDQDAYKKIVGESEEYPSPYGFLVRMCLGFVRNHVARNSSNIKINYMFESGHLHSSHAAKIFDQIGKSERLRKYYHYVGHSFVDKEAVPLVQSGDLLAWQTFQDIKKQQAGRAPRRDYEALIRPQDKVQIWSAAHLEQAAPLIWAYDHWDELDEQPS